MVTVHDPRYPRCALKLCVPEIERRQNHIGGVDSNHPLLPIALDCLKDADGERPSAQQLCQRVAALKETAIYKDASERAKDSSGKEGESEQIQSLQQNLEEKNRVIGQKDATIEQQLIRQQELTQQMQQQNQQIQRLEGEKRRVERERNQAIQEKERELGRVNQQLEESERLIADFGKRNTELEEQLSVLRGQVQEKDGGAKVRAVERANFKLKWREGGKAPCRMYRSCDAVVDGNTVYCKYDTNKNLYAYHMPSSNWSPIPDGLTNGFALTVIDGLPTTVGGFGDDDWNTNKLYSLTGEGRRRRWTEKYPPMPTKRNCMSALCTGTALIVAGGKDDIEQKVKTVEVLDSGSQLLTYLNHCHGHH